MGEVNRPGAYAISSYATAFNALYYVRGPKLNGSLRNIRILREGSVASNIDIYDYILKGFSTDDRRLQNNDIVFIPTRGSTVGIAGEVTSPGIYELTEGESIKDLIDYARGLKPTAYTFRVQIDRILPLKERIKGQVERKLIDIDLDSVLKNGETVPLADGDLVTVFSISEEMDNYIILSGEGVFRPGQYELNSNIKTLSDLVKAADGLKGDVYLNRAEIIRTRNDLEEEIIEVNLQDALRKNPSSDIELHRWDTFNIF